MIGFSDGLWQTIRQFANDLGDFVATVIDAIAKATYWVPHPKLEKPSDLWAQPESELWLNIYDFHWDTGVPIGLTILIGMWFLRTGGAAAGILDTESKVRANKNILIGIVAVFFSYYAAIMYVSLAHGLAIAIAPTEAELSSVLTELGLAGTSTYIAYHFLNVSVNALLLVLLLLVNMIRILAVYALPMMAWFFVAMYYAQIPIISPMITDLGKKLSTAALWVIPVAAGWRIMVVLNQGDEGILASALPATLYTDSVGAVDAVLSSTLFMLPLVIGIVSPLLMSNVSKLYYLSNIAGLSVGSSSRDGPSADPDGDGGAGGGPPSAGSGSDPDQMTLDEATSGGSGGSSPLDQIRAAGGKVASGASTASTMAKRHTPGLDENVDYVDWDQIERDKQTVGKFGDAFEKGGKVAGGVAATGADYLSEDEIESNYDGLAPFEVQEPEPLGGWESYPDDGEGGGSAATGESPRSGGGDTSSSASASGSSTSTSTSSRTTSSGSSGTTSGTYFGTGGEGALDDLAPIEGNSDNTALDPMSSPDSDTGAGDTSTSLTGDIGDEEGTASGGIDFMGSPDNTGSD